MNKKYFIALVLIIVLTSCQKKIYFTYDLKKKLEEKELDIKKVQFYNSEKIVLTRSVPHNDAQVNNGELKFENGKFVEEIIINKNTPGVCNLDNNNILGISFEQGDKVLNFQRDRLNNYYLIDAEIQANLVSKILYDSSVYVVQPPGIEAKLMVRKNDKYIYQLQQRVAEGIIVK
jgi:hypothetical protein